MSNTARRSTKTTIWSRITAGSNAAPDRCAASKPSSAHRFCRAYDEVRNFLRPATRRNQPVPAAQRRAIHVQRFAVLRDMLTIA